VLVEECPKNRSRYRNASQSDRRLNTKKYNLEVEGRKKVAVCKVMFLDTEGVTEKFLRVALKKKVDSGLVSTDDR
jgi:hypothetical protein